MQGAGAHPWCCHESGFEGEGSAPLMPFHVGVLACMSGHHVPLQLCFSAEDNEPLLPTLIEGAQKMFLLKMLFQLVVVWEVHMFFGVLTPADVAMVVGLLHVFVQGSLVIKVDLAETARTLVE